SRFASSAASAEFSGAGGLLGAVLRSPPPPLAKLPPSLLVPSPSLLLSFCCASPGSPFFWASDLAPPSEPCSPACDQLPSPFSAPLWPVLLAAFCWPPALLPVSPAPVSLAWPAP